MEITRHSAAEWTSRISGTPLTPQEGRVAGMLFDQKLSFHAHHTFDLSYAGKHPVDFLVFHGPGIVIECTSCSTIRGRAMGEVRRRAVFMQYWFSLLKDVYPKILCAALVEAPNEKQDKLARQLRFILKDADLITKNLEELRGLVASLRKDVLRCRTSGSEEPRR